jgi:hypothetical protein
MDDIPTAAESAIVNVTFWLEPAATDIGAEGETVTPCGRLCSVTLTLPVNPFCGVTVIVTGVVTPPTTEDVELGEMAMLKSAAGGGGEVVPAPPPPHASKQTIKEAASANCAKSRILLAALTTNLAGDFPTETRPREFRHYTSDSHAKSVRGVEGPFSAQFHRGAH